MKLIRKGQMDVGGNSKGIRVFGYLEENGVTLAMYILESLFGDRKVSVNLVVGDWGMDDETAKNKVALFSTLYLEPECGFVFSDPSSTQSRSYGKLAARLLHRGEVLSSPSLGLYKMMLDLIYRDEWLQSQSQIADIDTRHERT